MKSVALVFFVLMIVNVNYTDGLRKTFPENCQQLKILGLFDDSEKEEQLLFNAAIDKTNLDPTLLKETELIPVVEIVNRYDAFNVSTTVCKNLKQNITAIIGPLSDQTIEIVQSIAKYVSIPHVYPAYVPHGTVMEDIDDSTSYNIYPDLHLLSEGIAQLIYDMDWVSFTLMYETDEDLVLFQELLKTHDQFQYVENYAPIMLRQLPSNGEYRTIMKEAHRNIETRFVISCQKNHTLDILDQAMELGLAGDYYNYVIVSFDAHTLDFTKYTNRDTNITLFRLINVDKYIEQQPRSLHESYYPSQNIHTISALVYDSVLLLAKTLDKYLLHKKLYPMSLSCENEQEAKEDVEAPKEKSDEKAENGTSPLPDSITTVEPNATEAETEENNPIRWEQGLELTRTIHQTGVKGLSEIVKFNSTTRHRSVFILELVQLTKSARYFNNMKVLGTWSPDRMIEHTRNESELHTDIVEFIANRTFNVASKIGEPYLTYVDDYQSKIGNKQFQGFSLDLIEEIAKIVKFTYRFYIVEANSPGKKDPVTGKWNGIIKDLQDRRADLGICDLTINEERKTVVDFTKPFMTLGISILYKEGKKEDTFLFSFLQPIDLEVWLCVGTALLGVSLVLFFVSRCTPIDWESPHPCDPNTEELENQLTLVNCLWFSLGSVLQQGCDILPKAWSTRLVAALWWFFTLIMVSTYTANLAAFLTTKQLETDINSIEELSSQSKIKYGCYSDGATATFFKGSSDSLYQKVWATMESTKPSVFTAGNKEGVNRVLNDKQGYAFFMESSSVEYELERHCELTQIGGLLDHKGYGIAMPLNSPYRTEVSSAVLQLQENGVIRTLKDKWWSVNESLKCQRSTSEKKADENAMEFSNVGGVFLVLITGIGISFMLAILEFLWNIRKVAVVEKVTIKQAFWSELKFVLQLHRSTKPVKSKPSTPPEEKDPLVRYRQFVAFSNTKDHLL